MTNKQSNVTPKAARGRTTTTTTTKKNPNVVEGKKS